MKPHPAIGIVSLGCPRNLVDSESILGRLGLKGYPIVDIDKADVAIVNTCSFIKDAKVESIDAILDLAALKKQGKLKKIIVYGCLAQRYKDSLQKELPEVDAFVGSIALNHEHQKNCVLTPSHYRYLKISEGCVNRCSYCAIPMIKGRFVSLGFESVLQKAAQMDAAGISELNIIGQDISGYGLDAYGRLRLAELIEAIAKKARHIGWIRLLYLYPSRLTDELLSVIKDEPRVCKYIDMPVQHINGRILRLMHRATTKKEIISLITKIRKRIPHAVIRTSVIVGFPSESEKDFKELLAFIKEAQFERLGAFTYSKEESTPAYRFLGHIPEKIKQERFDAVMSLQQKISKRVNERFLGKTIEVLIDEKKDDCYLGRTQFDAPEVDGQVYVRSKRALKPGAFAQVHITDTLEYDLVGHTQGGIR